MIEDKKPENPRMHNLDGTYAREARLEDYFSLRDYFAGQTLQGISSLEDKGSYSNMEEAIIHQAEYCYKVADEMLKQREL